MTSDYVAPSPKIIATEAYITPQKLLITDDIYLIGRWEQCQISVQHETISRLHAKIERVGPRYQLLDTGSANGTFVNGKRVDAPHLLSHGDEIGLAKLARLLVFEDPQFTKVAGERLSYDETTATFTINAVPIQLAPSQFRLLLHLYQHSGQLCTRESCAQALWKREYKEDIDDDALDRTVANLRKRIRDVAPDSDFIQVRRGLGYQLVM